MIEISKYVSYAEATQTSTKITNVPNAKQLEAIRYLCVNVFDKVREHFGVPIKINSVFRSQLVNNAIGGADTSQHLANNGSAIDIDDTLGKCTNKQIFNYIKDNLNFDQLIWEGGTDDNPAWVHVSLKKSKNRKEVLRMRKLNGKSIYSKF